jgi:hypothetical protein
VTPAVVRHKWLGTSKKKKKEGEKEGGKEGEKEGEKEGTCASAMPPISPI